TKEDDYTVNQGVTHRNINNTSGGALLVIFFNMYIIIHDRIADRLFLEVEGHAHNACAEKFYQFEILHVLQAINTGDAIPYRNYGADAGSFRLVASKACDVLFYYCADFISP